MPDSDVRKDRFTWEDGDFEIIQTGGQPEPQSVIEQMRDREVARICKALQAEPLFHMSLGSKELFHSNFIAWFADRFPHQAAAAFATWGDSSEGTPGRPTHREPRHLDLILDLPGLKPIAIENKVFSVPDNSQLDRYAEGALKQRDAVGVTHSRILLSLMPPGWEGRTYRGWRHRSYIDLADILTSQIRTVQVVDDFAAQLLQHYVDFIRLLSGLVELLGTPDPESPMRLPDAIVNELDVIRISAGIQKARTSHVARALELLIDERGWYEVGVEYDFTNGLSLLGAIHRLPGGSDGMPGDAIGWQLQGTQFRLCVVIPNHKDHLLGSVHRVDREKYTAERYGAWFDFGLLEAVTGMSAPRSSEVRGGRWSFQCYEPAFVYRHRPAPDLTPAQIVRVGLAYLERAVKI